MIEVRSKEERGSEVRKQGKNLVSLAFLVVNQEPGVELFSNARGRGGREGKAEVEVEIVCLKSE